MYNFITVDFPTIDAQFKPDRVVYFALTTRKYQHEMAVVKFRDWNVNFDIVRPGTPVKCTIRDQHGSRDFVGYVSHITADSTPGKKFVEVAIIGASYVFKQASQTIFTDSSPDLTTSRRGYVLATDVVKQIARKHKFSFCVYPYERKFPQIAQAGHTDFELINRLAEQCGYSFFIKNTSLYFRPILHQFTNSKDNAKKFVMRDQDNPSGSTMYSFNLIAGETVNFDDIVKAAYRVSGVDNQGDRVFASVLTSKAPIRKKTQTEFFDKFATHIVANDINTARFEAKALDDRTRFPYRAVIEVDSAPNVYPDAPVYLDGIGKDYSGYWVVLGVTHIIVSEDINKFNYTTKLEVGSDSLGPLYGSSQVYPTSGGARILKPGVRNVLVRPSYSLYTPAIPPSSNKASTFGAITNKKLKTGAKVSKTPIWADSKGDISNGAWLL